MEPGLVWTILMSITVAIAATTLAEASRRHLVGVRLDRDLRGSRRRLSVVSRHAGRPGSRRAR